MAGRHSGRQLLLHLHLHLLLQGGQLLCDL
jgi:hypothetical protein